MDAVFVALADPTRRHLLELLAAHGAATATALSARFPMTRQAVTKHLQVLADAGLATSERRGRETAWTITPQALSPAIGWMESLGGEFHGRVAAWQRHLDERKSERTMGIGARPIGAPLRVAATGRPPAPPPRP